MLRYDTSTVYIKVTLQCRNRISTWVVPVPVRLQFTMLHLCEAFVTTNAAVKIGFI